MRGGARAGAGRKKNEIKTVCYHRRVKPEWVKILDATLDNLKNKDKKTEQPIKAAPSSFVFITKRKLCVLIIPPDFISDEIPYFVCRLLRVWWQIDYIYLSG